MSKVCLIFTFMINLNSATPEWKELSFLNQLSELLTIETCSSFVNLISLVFVFIIYMVILGLNNLYSKIILSNVVSISLHTTFLIVYWNITFENDNICKIFGYFGYFSAMSMFSWMTVLSFNHFCSTLDFFPRARGFMLYSVMGWGPGMVMTIRLFFFDLFLPPYSDFHPGIGDRSCFISTDGNKLLILFHIPTLIMMLINMSFFIIIIISNIKNPNKLKQSELPMR